MQPLDIIILALLAFGAIRGFMKGFIYEVAMLGALVLCYFLGFKMAAYVSEFLFKTFGGSPDTLRFVSYAIVWIGVSIGAWFLAKLFEGLIKITALGIFNKIAGALFGLLKYAFLIGLFLYFFNKADVKFNWIDTDKKAESIFYYPLLKVGVMVINKK
jgi:membrane protein required for colicin V production